MKARTQKQLSLNEQVDLMLKARLERPGFFAKKGWQAWLDLAIVYRVEFPTDIDLFIKAATPPANVRPRCYSTLNLMLKAENEIYTDWLSEVKREEKWRQLTTLMSISLTRLILSRPKSITAGVPSQESQQ